MRKTYGLLLLPTLFACSMSAEDITGEGSGASTSECARWTVASTLGVHLREEPSLSSPSIFVVGTQTPIWDSSAFEHLIQNGFNTYGDERLSQGEVPPVFKSGQVWRFVAADFDQQYSLVAGWMLERATDSRFVNLTCSANLPNIDYPDYSNRYDGGFDAGYPQDGGFDAGYPQDGGYDAGDFRPDAGY